MNFSFLKIALNALLWTNLIALQSLNTMAGDFTTHDGRSWNTKLWPGTTDPCYVPTDRDYDATLSLFASNVLRKLPTCITFPYMGDPYDMDGKYLVYNHAHAGIDFRAKTGDPVFAAHAGKVLWKTLCTKRTPAEKKQEATCVGSEFIQGAFQHSTLVIEDVSKAGKVFYLHMSEHAVAVGDKVCEGQYLGLAGSIGASASHLHIESWPAAAKGYAGRVRALNSGDCPGKPSHKLAIGATITSYCEAEDIPKFTTDPTSRSPNGWTELRLGETEREVAYRRVNNDGIALYRGQSIAKCITGDALNVESDVVDAVLGTTKLLISPSSSSGKYIAVFCSQDDSAASAVRIIDQSKPIANALILPRPEKLFGYLEPWISFSPDERYALLNQLGDEGSGSPIALDLLTSMGRIISSAPLINANSCPAQWDGPSTYRFRASSICDRHIDPDDVAPCRSLGIFEFVLDLPSLQIKRSRVADWDPYLPGTRRP